MGSYTGINPSGNDYIEGGAGTTLSMAAMAVTRLGAVMATNSGTVLGWGPVF